VSRMKKPAARCGGNSTGIKVNWNRTFRDD
jgi:hypothetical protein